MASIEWTGSTSRMLKENKIPPVSSEPMTVAIKFRPDVDSVSQDGLYTVFNVTSGAAGEGYFSLELTNTFSPTPPQNPYVIRAYKQVVGKKGTTTSFAAAEIHPINNSVWHMGMGIWTTNTNRSAHIGVCGSGSFASVSDTTNVTDPTLNNGDADQVIGQRPTNAPPLGPFDGHLKDLAIWNSPLGDEEIRAYLDGTHPGDIRPQNLVAYHPLDDDPTSPSLMKGQNGTGWLFDETAVTRRGIGFGSQSSLAGGPFQA